MDGSYDDCAACRCQERMEGRREGRMTVLPAGVRSGHGGAGQLYLCTLLVTQHYEMPQGHRTNKTLCETKPIARLPL